MPNCKKIVPKYYYYEVFLKDILFPGHVHYENGGYLMLHKSELSFFILSLHWFRLSDLDPTGKDSGNDLQVPEIVSVQGCFSFILFLFPGFVSSHFFIALKKNKCKRGKSQKGTG